jgi:hypothetical protein
MNTDESGSAPPVFMGPGHGLRPFRESKLRGGGRVAPHAAATKRAPKLSVV